MTLHSVLSPKPLRLRLSVSVPRLLLQSVSGLVKRVSLISLSACVTLIGSVSSGSAAPDTRGEFGGMYALAVGSFLGAGTDVNGGRSPSQLGGSVHITLGEEVLPRLFIGIGIDSHFGSGQGASQGASTQSQVFGFGFEGRYRLTSATRGFMLLGGIGFGVGGVIQEGETLTEAESSSGGSIWKVGLGYELGDSQETQGFIYMPRLTFQRIGPQMESEVSVNLVSLSLEVLYASGRTQRAAQ